LTRKEERMAKLSKPQEVLLKRIRRCPKGCYVEIRERKTAGKLVAAGLITLAASMRLAYPVEAKAG
jgi:hypothetical protein